MLVADGLTPHRRMRARQRVVLAAARRAMVPYMARDHGAGRRGADRLQQLRRAEAVEEARVGRAFAEHAVGAAVVVRQDRLGAVLGDDAPEALGDQPERVVPADALEAPLALGADAALRVERRAAASRRAPDSAAPWRR